MARRARNLLAGVAVAVGLGLATAPVSAGAAPAAPRDRFEVTSPAFGEGEAIPDGFTCDGADASPPLRWRHVPKGTEELALVMDDRDAPGGVFVHWVAWGIDPTARRLPEETLPAGVVEGDPAYLGPCPPPGDGPHRYRVTLYALDEPLTLTPGEADADALRAAIDGHVLARDRVVGTYER